MALQNDEAIAWAKQRAGPKGKQSKENCIKEVLPNLWLGNVDGAHNKDLLLRHRIGAIINVGAGVCPFQDTFKYLKIQVQDNDQGDLSPFFQLCCEFTQQHLRRQDEGWHGANGGGGVLIHCRGGISRSPAVMAAVLIRLSNLTLAQALEVIALARPAVRPRGVFLEQLAAFEAVPE